MEETLRGDSAPAPARFESPIEGLTIYVCREATLDYFASLGYSTSCCARKPVRRTPTCGYR
jgi:hypothetical protein